jgi:hypothetical protein
MPPVILAEANRNPALEESWSMDSTTRKPRRTYISIALLSFVALLAMEEGPSSALPGGLRADSSGVTLGDLATRLVERAAVNAPDGGYDEAYSMGILTYLGYRGPTALASTATLADAKGMLAALGVDVTTGQPEKMLTESHAASLMKTVGGSLKRFEAPETQARRGGRNGARSGRIDPCLSEFQECRRECLLKSPSGGSGNVSSSCLQECVAGRKSCREQFKESFRRQR